MINRAINTLMGNVRFCKDTGVRLLGHVWQIHMSVFFIIYLFIGFDLENVGFTSMKMVTELGLVV